MVAKLKLHEKKVGQLEAENSKLQSSVQNLEGELEEVQVNFNSHRLTARTTKVQLIGQKLNFNFCPTHGLTFLSCNSNEVQRERSVPL